MSQHQCINAHIFFLWESLKEKRFVGMVTNWQRFATPGMLLYVVRRSYGYFCLPLSPSFFLHPSFLTLTLQTVKPPLPFLSSQSNPPSLWSLLLLFTSVLSRIVSQLFLRINHPQPVCPPPHTDPHSNNTDTAVCVGLGSMAFQPVNLTPSVREGGKWGWAVGGCFTLVRVIFHSQFTVSEVYREA